VWLPFAETLRSGILEERCGEPLVGSRGAETGGSRRDDMPRCWKGMRSWVRQPGALRLWPVVDVRGSGAEVGGEGGEVRGVGGENAVEEAKGKGNEMGVDDV